ncbi:integrase core domain protein, partial [Oesophagostomum dentatum]
EIGMNLREYVSNDDSVNNSIPEIDRAPNGAIKFLGVRYHTKADTFSINLTFRKKSNLTKRDIVSQLNSIYDPIGMAGPITIKLKHLMREILECTTGWKDPVPSLLATKWKETCEKFENTLLSIPRLGHTTIPDGKDVTSVWLFADASEKALATCAYFRHEKTLQVTPLISGKTRLTPKRTKQTIPRLETLAILMAIRLARTIIDATSEALKEVNLLTDSEIVLSWIRSNRDLPPFVERQKNRILKIRDHLVSAGIAVNFFHVPTEYNIADAGTRGLSEKPVESIPWLQGPQWLSKEKTPSILTRMNETRNEDNTESTDAKICATNVADTQKKIVKNDKASNLLLLFRFSRLEVLLRVVARVGKIIKKWVERTNQQKELSSRIKLQKISRFALQTEITADDIAMSEIILFREAHRFVSLKDLQKRFPHKKLFRDKEGIIRNESRLQNALLPYDTKNPIFVDKDSDLARLILRNIHTKNAHCGKEHTLCLVRQRFWIPRPAATFSRYLKNCVICKKSHGLPYGAPDMPPLPKDRVVVTKPFENVGCDFMGPFQSQDNSKLYICLYTCLTTRAVHLEVVENMSAGAFLNSFTRFISRRGVPRLIRTDCGTNFKLGQQIIQQMFDQDVTTGSSLMSYSSNHGINWIFNPPGAPWMGGAWERLVGTVKRAFTKSVGRKKLSFPDLCTVVARIEAIVNTRPLTAVSSTVDEIPIRPVDFLQKSLQYSLPSADTGDFDDPSYDPTLIQNVFQVKQAIETAEKISEKFWQRWHIEYLTSLREMQTKDRKQHRHAKLRDPRIGEIVLVEQENLPRGSWSYGKIIELVKSNDGFVRSVKLLMPNKHIWHRAISAIYPLEISSTAEELKNSEQTAVENQSPESSNAASPRKAKLKAIEAIRDISKSTHNSTMLQLASPHFLLMSTIIALITLMSPRVSAATRPSLNCSHDSLTVFPPNTKFELCINSICKLVPQRTENLMLSLPLTSKNAQANTSKNINIFVFALVKENVDRRADMLS